jgi:hypothetical protein
MSAPRHLWSGEWQLDSAAVAEELARRRAQAEDSAPPPLEPEPPRPPSARERLLAALRGLRQRLAAAFRRRPRARPGTGRRLGLALVVVALLGAAVALGASALSGGQQGSPAASGKRGWLGISMTSAPYGGGAVITGVAPGSPAQMAGLQPGDLITQIDNQQIQSPADVGAALDGLLAGNQIQIQFNRGPASFSTLATLGARRSAGP